MSYKWTYNYKLVQEDAAEVQARGHIDGENTSGSVRREHHGVEFAGSLQSFSDFLEQVSYTASGIGKNNVVS